MKLRNLNGAVRKAGDKITVKVTAPDGRPIIFRIARSDTVKGLTEAFVEGTLETGLVIDADGALVRDPEAHIPNAVTAAALDAAEQGESERFDNVDDLMADLNDDEDLLADSAPASSFEDDDDIEDLLA